MKICKKEFNFHASNSGFLIVQELRGETVTLVLHAHELISCLFVSFEFISSSILLK